MPAFRTYGIPRVIESREIFFFNNGQGKLKVTFSGGVPDPKYQIPATYSTDNEIEQIIIENSPQFGKKVFRYGPNGNVIDKSSFAIAEAAAEKTKKPGRPAPAESKNKVYENVSTIGEATEVLLEMGAKADELTSQEDVVAAMVKYKASFPNLKF